MELPRPNDLLMAFLAAYMTNHSVNPGPIESALRVVCVVLFTAQCIALKYRLWG